MRAAQLAALAVPIPTAVQPRGTCNVQPVFAGATVTRPR